MWLIVPLLILLLLPPFIFMGLFAWHHLNTRGLAYFGRKQQERAQFKRRLARIGRVITPLMAPFKGQFADPNRLAQRREGLYIPSNTSNKESFARAIAYRPQARDVFVVTQMKCGTTWMQQLVYEVLSKGQGNLSDAGHVHMAAVSPWLESFNGVSLDKAPLVGESQRRIIKSHLPASHCPYDPAATYIYVTRHPVSCFLSIADFFAAMGGPMTPPDEALLDWFCSDGMWWGSWPAHVDGFWRWQAERDNVHFFHFEEMRRDLPAVVRTLAAILHIDLDEEQLARVVEKGSFEYMKAHETQFEMMVPPNFFSAGETFFRSGSARRHEAAGPRQKERIALFCREKLATASYPLSRYYPDIAG